MNHQSAILNPCLARVRRAVDQQSVPNEGNDTARKLLLLRGDSVAAGEFTYPEHYQTSLSIIDQPGY